MSLSNSAFELAAKRKREFPSETILVIRWSALLTLIAPHAPSSKAPSSTKNANEKRDAEMHQTKNGNHWHCGMKARIGMHTDSGLVHTAATTSANAQDITQAAALLHSQEQEVFADLGYRGVYMRKEVQAQHSHFNWHIAKMPGQHKAMNKKRPINALNEQLQKIKACIRTKVEHPFRLIKCKFAHRKIRYRRLAKNTSHFLVMFAQSNLWIMQKRKFEDEFSDIFVMWTFTHQLPDWRRLCEPSLKPNFARNVLANSLVE